MRYFTLTSTTPLNFSTCGQLISKDGFLHHRRCFEQNVLLLVTEGVLHITSAGQTYSVGPDQYLFLKAGEEHFGSQPSCGRLSYLWVHFTSDGDFHAASENAPASQLPVPYTYFFSEYGKIAASKRLPLLFHQLLDLSMEETLYTTDMLDYSLSLMMMELSQEYLNMSHHPEKQISPLISQICEWIKANYYQSFTVTELADEFGYQADYLSGVFKRHMGISLIQYTNKIRIETSKNLLANYGLSIKEAAYSCGFPDEKYYMKVFKKLEGLTPTEYKTAFFKKAIN